MQSPRRLLLLSACLGILVVNHALAQTINVFQPSGGSYAWNTNADWSSGVFPNAVGAVAVFSPANASRSLLGANVTIGGIYFDTDSGANTTSITPNGSTDFTITFQTSTGPAELLIAASIGSSPANFNSGITFNLASNLVYDDRNVSSQAIPEVIGGLAGGSAQQFIKTGVGFVSVAASSLTGTIAIEQGGFGISSNILTGVSEITVQSGGQFEIYTANSGSGNAIPYNLATGAVLVLNGNGRSGITGVEGAFRLDAANSAQATVNFSSAVQLQTTSDIYVDTLRTLTLLGTVSGSGGIIKGGPGILTLSAANSFSGNVTVNAGTLEISARGIGNAMGTSGNVTVANAAFQLDPITGTSSATNTSIGNLLVSGDTQIVINWSSTAGNTTLTANSLSRVGAGTVIFGPGAGAFGANSVIAFTTAPATTNGIVPFAVAQEASSSSGDFVSIGSGGSLAVATYTNQSTTSINTFPATGGTAIFNVNQSVTTSGNRSVAALRVIAAMTNTGNTLTVGTGTAAPIIINSNTLSGATLAFTGGTLVLNGEGLIYTSGHAAISAAIQGTAGLTEFGTTFTSGFGMTATSTLTLSGANSYTGPTTINSGTLSISSDANLGTAPSSATPGSIVINNGTLAITGSGTINASRGIALGTAGSAVLVPPSTSVVYNGSFSGSGGLTLSANDSLTSGGGTLTLGGSSTYTGPTSVQIGTVALGTNNALPTTTALSLLTVLSAPTLDLAGFSQTVGSLTFGSGQVTNSNIFAASTLTINNSETDTVSGPITSLYNGGLPQTILNLTKSGSGVLTLAGSNTYAGTTTVNGGVLIATTSASFGLAGNNLTIGNAAVEVNAPQFGSGYTLTAGVLTASGGASLVLNSTSLLSITFIAQSLAVGSGATLVLNPTVGTLNSGSTFQFTAAPSQTNGIITPAVIVQEPSSTAGDFVTLNSSNQVIAATYTNQSSTSINSYAASGGTAIQNIDVNVATTASRSAYALRIAGTTLTNTGNVLTVGNGAGHAGVIMNGGSIAGGTLAFGGAQGAIYTSTSGGVISSQVTGTAGLITFGPGTVSLSGSVNVGAVNVNGGQMRVDGVLTGNVSANNGLVGGNGQIQGNLTILPAGGLNPGNPSLLASGVLTATGAVSFQSGSTFTVQANGNTPGSGAGQYSQLVLASSGSLNLGSGTSLYVDLGLGYVPAAADQLYILRNQSSNAVNGTFAGLPQGSSFYVGSSSAYISYVGNYSLGTISGGHDVVVYFTPTPEPHHVLLIASLTLAVVVFYRRAIKLRYEKA